MCRAAVHRLGSAGPSAASLRAFSPLGVAALIGCLLRTEFRKSASDAARRIAAPRHGEVIGTGSVRVALLLPRSAGGQRRRHGAGLPQRRRAGDARFSRRRHPDRRLRHQGNAGRRAGRRRRGAARTAPRSFSARCSRTRSRRSRRQARQAGVPVVAFSSDAGVAGPGVYLLSFLPSDDVNRIVSYSASQGRKSFAALLPANAYGAVVGGGVPQRRRDGRRTHRGDPVLPANDDDARAKAAAIASIAPQIDALLVPDSRRRGAGDRGSARRARRHARQGASCSAPASGTIRAS